MLRDDETAAAGEAGPGDIVDAVFAISCRCLPVDHAWALAQALAAALPWFAEEPGAGLHTVHGAASGSGWMRPEGADALLQLSHRARLALRLPRHRAGDAAALLGRTLDVAGWPLQVDRLSLRPLSRITTLYARSVVFAAAGGEIASTIAATDGPSTLVPATSSSDEVAAAPATRHEPAFLANDNEPTFLAHAADELRALAITPGTLLCGRVTPLATPTGAFRTRSLMLAGLTREQSLVLQRQGLGALRKLGCGVFIPHKDIGDLDTRSD